MIKNKEWLKDQHIKAKANESNLASVQKERLLVLKKARLCLLSYTSEEAFDDIQISGHAVWGQIVVRALKTAMVHKISNSRVQHPENWKEAFKERWLPKWLKKKYPIKYKEYDAYLIFPDYLKYNKVKMGKAYLHYDSPGGILGKQETEKDLCAKITTLEQERFKLNVKITNLEYANFRFRNAIQGCLDDIKTKKENKMPKGKMRSKKEILKQVLNSAHPEFVSKSQQLGVLEVLIDIRDILEDHLIEHQLNNPRVEINHKGE